MNFYKRYIGDYQRDTGHLSILEHGAYGLLLDAFYARNGQLPVDKKLLHRLLRATTREERKAVDSVLAQFWTLGDGNWLNKRALSEIDKASAQAETNRRIAADREANRSTNRDTNRSTNRSTKSEPIHSHSHSHKEQEEKQPPLPPARKLADVPEGFLHWYEAYPRKRGRLAAVRAWKKIKPSRELAAQMASAIRNQVAQDHFRGNQWVHQLLSQPRHLAQRGPVDRRNRRNAAAAQGSRIRADDEASQNGDRQ